MAYARMGDDSDVYVWLGRYWECSSCRLKREQNTYDPTFKDLESLRNHLVKHVEAGHMVPQRTFDRIDREMREEWDEEPT